MERDYGKEIDEIKKDIAEIKAMLTNEGKKSRETTLGDEVGHVKRMNNMHPNENIMKLMHDCETVCGEKNLSGCITYLGVFASGGRQSSWVRMSYWHSQKTETPKTCSHASEAAKSSG